MATAATRDAPEVVAPPPGHARFPLADGVRGIAACAIVVVHVWLFTGGFGGFGDTLANRALVRLDGMVAIFFVLSAFLLYRPMIAERAGGAPAPSVGDYMRRRLLRIYPAYWVALTGLAIVPGIYGVFSGRWWEFYSLTDYFKPSYNSAICPAARPFDCGLPQSWTLTVEMTFYLVLPLYAWVTARLARGRSVQSWVRAELLLLGGLAAISVFLNVDPLTLRHHPWFHFSFAAHFYWLSLGLGMAVISAAYPRPDDLPRAIRALAGHPGLCWLGALGIYLLTVATLKPVPFIVADQPGPQFLLTHLLHGLLAALLVFPVVFSTGRGVPARVLGNRVLLWLGLISYGFYLWHVTIAYDLGFGGASAGFVTVLLMTVAIAIPIAALSYYLIERPLMRLKYLERR